VNASHYRSLDSESTDCNRELSMLVYPVQIVDDHEGVIQWPGEYRFGSMIRLKAFDQLLTSIRHASEFTLKPST